MLLDVLAGYGIAGEDDAVDAARFVRSTLHGFVGARVGGGFAMAARSTAAPPAWSRPGRRSCGPGATVGLVARPAQAS